MLRALGFLLLSVFFCTACRTDVPQADRDSSSNQSSASREQSADNSSATGQATVESGTAAAAVTRKDLDQRIANYNDTSAWHYGERTDGELAGTWMSVDGDGHHIVFGADGSFSTDFNGNMTTGLYAISDNGRIVAFSKWNGIGLGSHFMLDGKTLTGPKGPRPNAQWTRTEAIK